MILQPFSDMHNDFAFSINFFIFSDGEVLLRVYCNTSTTVFPVIKILFEFLFSFKRLLAAHSVGEKYSVLISSIEILFNSSGKGKYKLFVLSPASTWKTGIF